MAESNKETFEKITKQEIAANGIQALANRPNKVSQYGQSGLSATELKKWFDKLTSLIADKVNSIASALESKNAPKYIAMPEDWQGYESLGVVLSAMLNGTLVKDKLKINISEALAHNGLSLNATVTLQYCLEKLFSEVFNKFDDLEDDIQDGSLAQRLTLPHEYGEDEFSTLSKLVQSFRSGSFASKILKVIYKDKPKTVEEHISDIYNEFSLYPTTSAANSRYANKLEVSYDADSGKLHFGLYSKSGATLSSQTIDLPLESSIVSIDETERDGKPYLVLTLASGSTTEIELDDLFKLKSEWDFIIDTSDKLGEISNMHGNVLIKCSPPSSNYALVVPERVKYLKIDIKNPSGESFSYINHASATSGYNSECILDGSECDLGDGCSISGFKEVRNVITEGGTISDCDYVYGCTAQFVSSCTYVDFLTLDGDAESGAAEISHCPHVCHVYDDSLDLNIDSCEVVEEIAGKSEHSLAISNANSVNMVRGFKSVGYESCEYVNPHTCQDYVTDKNILYGTDTEGNQSVYSVDYKVSGTAIVQRTIKGCVLVPDEPKDFYSEFEPSAAINTNFADKRYGSRIDAAEFRLEQLESATLKFTEDSSVAYEKIVPANSAKYALVNKVGGMGYRPSVKNYLTLDGDEILGSGGTVEIITDGNAVTIMNPQGIAWQFDMRYHLEDGEVKNRYFTSLDIPSGFNATMDTLYDAYDEDNNPYVEYSYNRLHSWLDGDYYDDRNYISIIIPPRAGTFTFHLLLTDTDDIGFRGTKVTELVSEGANLIPFPYMGAKGVGYTSIQNGVTFTVLEDRGVQAIGTPTDNTYFDLCKIDFGEQTLMSGSTNNKIAITDCGYNGKNKTTSIDLKKGITVNKIFYPIINRGSTAAPYKPYRGTLNTFFIRPEIQALDGYGRGVSGYPNYIDFERKVFVQNTYCKVFDGTEDWKLNGTIQTDLKRMGFALSPKSVAVANSTVGHLICDSYEAVSGGKTWENTRGASITGGETLHIYDENYQTLDAWKAHLAELKRIDNPLTIEYALAEPIETDISAHLTDDNFIEVEGGGVIRAVNEHEFDAPTTIAYVSQKGS